MGLYLSILFGIQNKILKMKENGTMNIQIVLMIKCLSKMKIQTMKTNLRETKKQQDNSLNNQLKKRKHKIEFFFILIEKFKQQAFLLFFPFFKNWTIKNHNKEFKGGSKSFLWESLFKILYFLHKLIHLSSFYQKNTNQETCFQGFLPGHSV